MLRLFNRLVQNISKGRDEELFKQPYYGPSDPNLDDPLWFFDSYSLSLTIYNTNHIVLSDNNDCFYTIINGKLKVNKKTAAYQVFKTDHGPTPCALRHILQIQTDIQKRAEQKFHTVNVLKIDVRSTAKLPLSVKLKLKKILVEHFMKLNGLPCLVLIEENNFYQDLASAVDCKSLVYRIEGSDKITVDDKILSYDFLYLDTLVTNIERLERFKGRGLIIGKCIQNHVPVDVFLKQFLCWRTGANHLSIFGVHSHEKLDSSYIKVWHWLVEQADETGSLVKVRLLFARFARREDTATVYWNGRAIFMVVEKKGVGGYQALQYIVSLLQEEF